MEAALEYAQNFNWYIFPTREVDGKEYRNSEGKMTIPIAKSPYTTRGLHDSSSDLEQIRKWWTRWPHAGIGLDCGKSRVFSIDIDNHRVGEKSGLEFFMGLGVPHARTFQSLTVSGGIHLIYSDEDGIGRTKTDNKTQIDQRGRGGYIVLPPSVITVISTVEKVETVNGEEVTKIEMVKEKRAYTKIGDWSGKPMKITLSYLKLLNQGKESKVFELDFEEYLDGISKQDIERVFQAMRTMPVDVAHDRGDWIAIGATLKMFGKRGWKAWEWWTNKYLEEKLDSNRVGTLERTWNGFNRFGCRINTIFYHNPVPKNWRPSNG